MLPDTRKRIVAILSELLCLLNRQQPEDKEAALMLLLVARGYFDPAYYLGRNRDVADCHVDPVWHYIHYGYKEGRAPAAWLEPIVRMVRPERLCECLDLTRFLEFLLTSVLMGVDDQGRQEKTIKILRQGSYEAAYDLPLHVQWSITHMCNFRCSYCSAGQDRIDRSKFYPLSTLLNAVSNLARLNRPAYEFVLLGGEPTVYPQMLELVDHLDKQLEERLKRVTIVSNGSRSPDYFNQMAELASRIYLQLMVSIHTEFLQTEHLYRLVREVDPAIELNLLLMMNPEKLDYAKEIYAQLCEMRKKRAFNLILHTIYGPPDFTAPDPRYPEGFADWQNEEQARFWQIGRSSGISHKYEHEPLFNPFWEILDNGRVFMYPAGDRTIYHQKGWLDFKDMYCMSGAHMARIDHHGNLQGVACGLFDSKINIYKENSLSNTDFMEMVTCPAKACVCSDNDLIMKFADKNEAERYLQQARLKQERLFKAGNHGQARANA